MVKKMDLPRGSSCQKHENKSCHVVVCIRHDCVMPSSKTVCCLFAILCTETLCHKQRDWFCAYCIWEVFRGFSKAFPSMVKLHGRNHNSEFSNLTCSHISFPLRRFSSCLSAPSILKCLLKSLLSRQAARHLFLIKHFQLLAWSFQYLEEMKHLWGDVNYFHPNTPFRRSNMAL